MSLSVSEWRHHNEWERKWWGSCANTFEEQLKQEIYAEYMRLNQFVSTKKSFDMRGKSIVDVGGGPVSLLLRCVNFSRAVVVDPCDYPEWVEQRYRQSGIELIKNLAENVSFDMKFDEAWCYNCLEHVMDPDKVVRMMIASALKIRVCEYLITGKWEGHPHNLTREWLDKMFQRQGLVDEASNPPIYFGVFHYG